MSGASSITASSAAWPPRGLARRCWASAFESFVQEFNAKKGGAAQRREWRVSSGAAEPKPVEGAVVVVRKIDRNSNPR